MLSWSYLFDARISQESCKEIPGLSSQLCYRGPLPSATYSRWNILSWSASGKFPFHGTQVRSFTCLVSLSGGHSSFLILLKLLDLLRLLGGFLLSCYMDLSKLILSQETQDAHISMVLKSKNCMRPNKLILSLWWIPIPLELEMKITFET